MFLYWATPVRRPLAGGARFKKKMDKNLKFLKKRKKGESAGTLLEWVLYDKNVPVQVLYWRKFAIFRFFARLDQILASFRKKWQIKCQNEYIVQNSN